MPWIEYDTPEISVHRRGIRFDWDPSAVAPILPAVRTREQIAHDIGMWELHHPAEAWQAEFERLAG